MIVLSLARFFDLIEGVDWIVSHIKKKVFDSTPDETLDSVTKVAAYVCETPIALITFADFLNSKIYFKSKVGLDAQSVPIGIQDEAFCIQCIYGEGILIVEDAENNTQFCNSPLVTGGPKIRFYASIGLMLDEHVGVNSGTLAVLDFKPRKLSQAQIDMLKNLAKDVVAQLQLRRTLNVCTSQLIDLHKRHIELESTFHNKQYKANKTELDSVQGKHRSQFISMINHEMRTPANLIQCATTLLQSSPLNSEQHEYLNVIVSGNQQLQCILDSILQLDNTSRNKGIEEEFDVRKMLSTLIDVLKSDPTLLGKRLLIGPLVDDNIPKRLFGNSSKISQILTNFLQNAVKFTDPDMGAISMILSVSSKLEGFENINTNTTTTTSTTTLSSSQNGIFIFGSHNSSSTQLDLSSRKIMFDFCVKDNGIGIHRDVQEILFTPFVQGDRDSTRKFGGMGLGLSISESIATEMGGSITLMSNGVGKGCVVTLTLPLSIPLYEKFPLDSPSSPTSTSSLLSTINNMSPQNIETNAGPSSTKEMHSLPPLITTKVDLSKLGKTLDNSLQILVVEDNLMNQKIVGKILEKLGYSPHFALDGTTAIQLFCTHSKFDLIFMDLHMGQLDGFQTAKIILNLCKGLGKNTKIVALSSSVSPEDKKKCLDIGMIDHLSKPLQLNDLIEFFNKLKLIMYK